MHSARNTALATRCAALGASYVEHYNNIRWNSAIGYIIRRILLAGQQYEIHTERDQKLAAAR
jgi:hypothetical protein